MPHDWPERPEVRETFQTLFDHVEGQVAFGDTKGSLLIAANAILLSACLSAIGDFALFDRLPPLGFAFLVVVILMLLAALTFAIYAVVPNTEAKKASGAFYFGNVARRADAKEFADKTLAKDEETLEREMLASVYGKSVWAFRKFKWLRWAILCTLASLVCGLVVALAFVMGG